MHTKSLASLRMGIVRQHLGKVHKQEMARQGEGAATAAGATAIISAMRERSRVIGSSAADLLQKEAESRRTNGRHPTQGAPCSELQSLYLWLRSFSGLERALEAAYSILLYAGKAQNRAPHSLICDCLHAALHTCLLHVQHMIVFSAGMEEGDDRGGAGFSFERDIDLYIPVEVTETRLTGQQSCSSQLLVHLTLLSLTAPIVYIL